MWKEYSASYIKNNRASGLSIMVAAFISALLLSLLCGLFYNFWVYEIERIKQEEGDWQGRITGEMDVETLSAIRNYANVEKAEINEELSDGATTAVDITFRNKRSILQDMPRILQLTGLPSEAGTYHYELLNMYLIRDPQDPVPRLIFPFLLAVMMMACVSLIMIIHNSFGVTMNARIRQFGILSSIGATPAQIRTCLLQEAAALCVIPVAVGNVIGIVISMGVITGINRMLADVEDRMVMGWSYHSLVLILSLIITLITVWISAWIPALKMSRLTPLSAIKSTGELQLKRKKHSRILAFMFGMEGELAGNAIKAQKKALRTASAALTISFLAFTVMMCFFTLTAISQRMTYFIRYQDAWDVMATVKNTSLEEFQATASLQALPDTDSVCVYQKASVKRIVSEEEFSEEFRAMGGMQNAPAAYVTPAEGGWLVNVPVLILDDVSFQEYVSSLQEAGLLDEAGYSDNGNFSESTGFMKGDGNTDDYEGEKLYSKLQGAVVINRIRDVNNPNFRDVQYSPYLKETGENTVLCRAGEENIKAEIPVIGYTRQLPRLKEAFAELDYYELVHVVPLSLWKEIADIVGGAESDLYVRILAGGRNYSGNEKSNPGEEGTIPAGETNALGERENSSVREKTELADNVTLAELNEIIKSVEYILDQKYEAVIENRIQDKKNNEDMINGMMLVLGGFCALLAVIGIGNVFSNTLGFVRQRKREFARYLSVGLTPEGIRKMFCVEALVIAGRPVLITVPLTVIGVGVMIKASYLEPAVFLQEAPLVPISVFFLAILGFVALAYYLGARKVLRCSLIESLRDDTMI